MIMKAHWPVMVASIIALLLLAACGGDDNAGGEDGDTAAKMGDACNTHDECESGLCYFTGAQRFCSQACAVDEDCSIQSPGACCKVINSAGVCYTAALCGGGDIDAGTPGYCTADEKRCLGLELQRCNSEGTDYEFYRECETACENKKCTGEDTDGDAEETLCTADETRCKEDSTTAIEICAADGMSWGDHIDCAETGQTCENGACIGEILGDPCNVNEDNSCEDDQEYCLADYAGAADGHCAKFCDIQGVYCPLGWECPHGECEPIDGFCRSIDDCEADEYCNKPKVTDEEGNVVEAEGGLCARYCFENGESCAELYKCVEDPVDANYGKCTLKDPSCVVCSNDTECGDGYYCGILVTQTSGCCMPSCYSDDDCQSGMRCDEEGHCAFGEGAGDCGGVCPKGHICEPTYNQCILNCPQCPQNYRCDADSAPNCYQHACDNPYVCGLLMPPCCWGYSCNALAWGIEGVCVPGK